MSLSLKISDKQVRDSLRKAPQQFRTGCMKGFHYSGRHIRDGIRKLIKDPPKTGVKYRSLPNRSSRTGEAPANQYGKLRKGVTYKVWRFDLMQVGDTVSYGVFLEDGTFKMGKRPHISPIVSRTYHTVLMMLEIAVRQELGKK